MNLEYESLNNEPITVGMLKKFLDTIPDNYVLEYPGDDVGYSKAKRIDIDEDNKCKTVMIYIGD